MLVTQFKKRAKVYYNLYTEGTGSSPATAIVEQTFAQYQCEKCDRQTDILLHSGLQQVSDLPTEEFYCRGCGKSIGIEPMSQSVQEFSA